MNRILPRIGAAIVSVTIFLFAVCLIADFPFGSYLVCMFLPIGYIMMTAGVQNESSQENRVAANIGLIFSAVYAVLILLVYYAQTTSVRLENLNEQAAGILNYQRGGLLFNYDLLGYGMMALSTFFTGLSFKAGSKANKWLKTLMMLHGVFFLSCFFHRVQCGPKGAGKLGQRRIQDFCTQFLFHCPADSPVVGNTAAHAYLFFNTHAAHQAGSPACDRPADSFDKRRNLRPGSEL